MGAATTGLGVQVMSSGIGIVSNSAKALATDLNMMMSKRGDGDKYEKGDDIGIERFTQKGKKGELIDPKSGERLSPDRGRSSGVGGHAGSWWKLLNKKGERIGTISKDGKWLRP